MTPVRLRTTIHYIVAVCLVLSAITIAAVVEAAGPDALASEIARWKEFVANNKDTDQNWQSIRQATEPLLNTADQAAARGRTYYTLHLLGAVRYLLAAQKYVDSIPSDSRQQMSVLEARWKKTGETLAPVMDGKDAPALAEIPAAAQAIAEVSLGEIKPYYEASLEYGRNTVADSGLFYIGCAESQLEFARFCSTLRMDHPSKQIQAENLAAEMDEFEGELLSQYKPPASVNSHVLFIRTSAALKEARELLAAGHPYGALYRYLNARFRFAGMASTGRSITPEDAAQRANAIQKQLDEDGKDHSIAQLFLQLALTEVENTSKDSKGGEMAAAVFDTVLPHYFASLQPAKPQPPKPTPAATVTLVRWPYT